ncbi:MAG TPA: MBL fold metallo-hydrolase [Acidobacteriaceae bacterium]|nr:MBL fold metallo-hydrolase [Acidobacteriaceae bacterium]
MSWIKRAERVGGKFQNPVPTGVGDGKTMFKILWRSLTNRAETTPKKPLGPFRTDARVFDVAPESGLRVTWMGHSSMLIEIDGVRILTDPVWDERTAPMTWAGPKRFFAPPLKLEELPRIDAVLISHDHYDHLGGWTIPRLARMENLRNARWVAPLGVGGILTEMGAPAENIDELDWTDSITVSGLRITALPARHFSGRSLFNRFETLWASYALAGPCNRVYYGADSGEWDGFAEIASQHGPFDLTMLEIGASDPMWRQIHMGPEGALRSFAAMGGQGLLMPIHWGLFNLALHAWRQPIERIFAESGVMLWSPEPGLPTEVVRGVELRSEWWR